MEDLVSVIVPMYNSEKYIFKCLKSLMNQTYKNIEIIVINDGSTDNSLKIVSRLARRDNRIKVLNQVNMGSGKARIAGLKCLDYNSRFFTFCDADDYVSENYILRMLQVIKTHSADIVACPSIKFLGPFKRNAVSIECFKKMNIYNHDDIMEKLYISYFGITNFPGYMHSKLYDKKWASFMIHMPMIVKFMADDLTVNIRLLPLCSKVVTIPEPLYYYRFGGGTSKFMPDFMNDYMNYHKLQLEMIELYNLGYNFIYFSSIEIINVLHTWILMCSINKNFSDYEIWEELKKWRANQEIIYALNNIKKWEDSFKILFDNCEFDDLLNIIFKERKKGKANNSIKKIVSKIFT